MRHLINADFTRKTDSVLCYLHKFGHMQAYTHAHAPMSFLRSTELQCLTKSSSVLQQVKQRNYILVFNCVKPIRITSGGRACDKRTVAAVISKGLPLLLVWPYYMNKRKKVYWGRVWVGVVLVKCNCLILLVFCLQ